MITIADLSYICGKWIDGSSYPSTRVSKQPFHFLKSVCNNFKLFALCYTKFPMT